MKLCEDTSNNAICDAGEIVTATFTFDADRKRAKSVMGADTTLFPSTSSGHRVGAHYEIKNGSEITKYYLAGTIRVAMRKYTIPQNMTVEYLLSDQLGSTSLTTDTSGAKVLELRYKAWGEVRATWKVSGLSTTPAYKMPLYTYTGQYSYMDDPTTSGVTEGFGLMFYNARWYDPYLNHFTQPDSIVPLASQGVQAYDRYAYSNNNPVRYSDPSGHMIDNGCRNGCGDSAEGFLALAHITKREAKRNEYHQKAIVEVIKFYKIDISNVNGTPQYSPTLSSDGFTAADTDPDRNIRIGNLSFESAGFLAATIYHETIHATQIAEGRYYGPETQADYGYNGRALNEYEAYNEELTRANEFGLTEQQTKDITFNRDAQLSAMHSLLVERVLQGNYTLDGVKPCDVKWCE